MICERCGKETICTIMSKFNTQNICMNCKNKERSHPKYKEAAEAELAAVRSGDYNYPGIGKPSNL
jgi:hypothetical protein